MSNKHRIRVDLETLRDTLRAQIINNDLIQKEGLTPITYNIEGGHGIGKTSMVSQLAEELNKHFVRLNLATLEELGDLIGMPIQQFEICKKRTVPEEVIVDVEREVVTPTGPALRIVKQKQVVMVEEKYDCMFVDAKTYDDYIREGYHPTGEKRTSYCTPEWIQGKDDGRGGILLLDDHTRADPRFIQATMTLIETQSYYSWKLPPGWTILMTTNPDNGEYFVTPMDDAQTTRYITFEVMFNEEVWARWAEKAKVDSRCINFVLLHPEFFKGTEQSGDKKVTTAKTNPRSAGLFFNSIRSISDFSNKLELLTLLGEGSVGHEFSIAFSMFINNRLDKLVSPKDMLLGGNEKVEELYDCIYKEGKPMAAIASVLHSRLINYTVNYIEDHKVTPEISDRLEFYISDPKSPFTEDLKFNIIKKLIAANRVKFQKLCDKDAVKKMIMA